MLFSTAVGSDQHSDDMELYDEGYQDDARMSNTAPPHHLGLRIRTSLFSAIEVR